MNPDPLELPVQKLEFVCCAETPVSFWPWDTAAPPFEVLLARAMGGAPPGPVYIRILDDFDDCPRREFELEVTLWGRRAVAAGDEIRAGIRRLAEELQEPAPFTFEERPPIPARTLREHAEDMPRRARRLCLTIETPLDIDGVPPFDLAKLVADSARRLAIFDMEDRGGAGLDDLAAHADETARTARELAAPLELGFGTMGQEWIGEEDCTAIGWTGHAEYERPPPEVWPWLLALTLGRGGRRRHEGFGAFSLWVQAGP